MHFFTFALYLVAVFAIGVIAWRKTQSNTGYFLGDRSLGPTATALSAGASDMSGWLLLGLPGYAYLSGFEAVWLAGGLLVGTWLNWLIVAKPLRKQSAELGAITVPAFIASRFGDPKGLVRPLAGVAILIFFTFYTSSGLVAGGKLFVEVFGVSYQWAVLIGALAVMLYTLFGGFLAVAWTDVIQGLLMSIALLAVPLLLWSSADAPLMSSLAAQGEALLDPLTDSAGNALSVIAILGLAGWGLGYFGQPHILARFMAVKSEEAVKPARRIAVAWTAVCLVTAMGVGLLGRAFMDAPLEDAETVFMAAVGVLFHPLIAGMMLAAILAAIMSTADSQLLVASSALSEDIVGGKVKLTSKQALRLGRVAVVVVAAIATAMAMNPDSGVLDLVSFAWAGFGATFGPIILFAALGKRTSWQIVFAAILASAILVPVWKSLSGGPANIFDLYELVPGFVLASIILWVGKTRD